MKKYIINLLRRACGTAHLMNEIEQLKHTVHEKNFSNDIEQLSSILHEKYLSVEQLAYQINCNILQSLTKTEKKQFVLRSWDKPLTLYATKQGLSFSAQEGNESLPKMVIVTLPKSGTYFWGKILQECGYQDIEIHGGEDIIADYRSLTLQEKLDHVPELGHWLPLHLQLSLLHKGQYLLGHFPFNCLSLIREKKFFITVRDLRTFVVSWLRFGQRRRCCADTSWHSLGATEEGIFSFLTSPTAQEVIYQAKEIVKWVSAFPDRVLRYEALNSPGSKEFAHIVDTLSSLTGLDAETVDSAISRARGASTVTYSGKPSSTQGIWSERIEEAFCAHKLDLLNEKLGYSREWKKID